ncbi:LuxR C-terminal-related transcriptional regulator [Streptomyces sp. NPDC017966]|uniref:helix-turn-helix transcriptional regulator n=1 Tax=Streptomyces sp. NPDC017966 TaxID=3365023 RepID=UPI0037AC2271
MPSPTVGGKSPIPVLLHASDPLSEAGARARLSDQRAIVLTGDGSRPGTVSLLVANSADDEMVTQWCASAPAGGPRAVLVTGRLRKAGLSSIVAGGIGAVVWRHEATGPRLVRAVTAVARGEGDMPADLVRALMDQVSSLLTQGVPGCSPRLAMLTSREVSILRGAADGEETGEIADRLGYSERTIKRDLHDLMKRLHLRNRTHAVAYAMRAGYM